jgi:hypothetical protein
VTALVTSRRSVRLAGWVTNALTAEPLAAALVTLVVCPEELRRRLDILAGAGWPRAGGRPDRCWTRTDGSYWFVDLPSGRYRVEAVLPRMGTRYGSVRSGDLDVPMVDQPTRAGVVLHDLALPPTAIRGRVTAADGGQALAGARVGLRGDARTVVADGEGRYLLHPVGAGEPVLEAHAQGFAPGRRECAVEVGRVAVVDVALPRPG